MADFKGFGSRRSVEIVPLHGTERDDFDRCLNGYKRQGLSTEDALNMVAVSNLYMEAESIGLTPGVDVQYDPNANNGEGGIYFSPPMTDHMQGHIPEKVWDYWNAEGMLSTAPPELQQTEDGDGWLTCRGAAKFFLMTARHPEETNDGGEKARAGCREMLQKGGVSAFDAERKLRQWIAGDDTLLAELLSPMEAALNEMARKSQEGGNG